MLSRSLVTVTETQRAQHTALCPVPDCLTTPPWKPSVPLLCLQIKYPLTLLLSQSSILHDRTPKKGHGPRAKEPIKQIKGKFTPDPLKWMNFSLIPKKIRVFLKHWSSSEVFFSPCDFPGYIKVRLICKLFGLSHSDSPHVTSCDMGRLKGMWTEERGKRLRERERDSAGVVLVV